MYDLTQQVGEANRHAVVACALLAGREPLAVSGEPSPTSPNSSRGSRRRSISCRACRARRSTAPADKEVVFTFKNGATRRFTGRSLLLTFSVPQFFFHVTTAYDILRHAGVDLAKKDFLGPPR